jgi:hypothetical protein
MSFRELLFWNPFSLMSSPRPKAVLRQEAPSQVDITAEKEETTMADASEFEIPSAILAYALVEKSELKGAELESYAINIQRKLVRQMMIAREKMDSEQR